MYNTPLNKTKTDLTSDEIDIILCKLDDLIDQLPEDYQQDYAQEILERFEEE